MEAKAVSAGDPCPNCGEELRAARTLTAEEHARHFDKENPIAVPKGVDTMHPRQRAELGDLHRCINCGYETRLPSETASSSSSSRSARGGKRQASENV